MTANMIRALELQEQKRANKEKEKMGWISTFLNPLAGVAGKAVGTVGKWTRPSGTHV